jgi:hypothetical protein
MAKNTRSIMQRLVSILPPLFIILFSTINTNNNNSLLASAYRIGDAVDTDVVLSSTHTADALRSQMPKFGLRTRVEFAMEPPSRVQATSSWSLLFEDGLRRIQSWPYKNAKGETLDQVVVTFIYSRSGAGMIHSVQSQAFYQRKDVAAENFRVVYEWMEEEPVRLLNGYIVMFSAVFISTIFILLQTCGLFSNNIGHDELPDESKTSSSKKLGPMSSHKKW